MPEVNSVSFIALRRIRSSDVLTVRSSVSYAEAPLSIVFAELSPSISAGMVS